MTSNTSCRGKHLGIGFTNKRILWQVWIQVRRVGHLKQLISTRHMRATISESKVRMRSVDV